MGINYTDSAGNITGAAVSLALAAVSEDGLAGDVRNDIQANDYDKALRGFLFAQAIILISILLFGVGVGVILVFVVFMIGIILAIPISALGSLGGVVIQIFGGLFAILYLLIIAGAFVVLQTQLFPVVINNTSSKDMDKQKTESKYPKDTALKTKAQIITINVVDENGEPVVEKPIKVNSKSDGEFQREGTTGTDGSFTLEVPVEISKIQVSVGKGLLSRKGTIELDYEKTEIEGEFIYTTLFTNISRIL